MSFIIRNIEGCLVLSNEGSFFELQFKFDRIRDDNERIAAIVKNLKLSKTEWVDATLQWLESWVKDHPNAKGLHLYLEAKRYLTDMTGNRFWAQKATSYIYYAREILTRIPDARIIYLLRNPFDLCTSERRRNPHEAIVGQTLGWNGGIRTVERIERGFPGRVHIVKYEDLVTHPKHPLTELCQFLGIPYSDSLLDVPHVNSSEHQFYAIEGTRGINKSRLFYYDQQLPDACIAGVSILAAKPQLQSYYPQLPHQKRRLSFVSRCLGLWLVIAGSFLYAIERIRWTRKTGSSLMRRTYRRLVALGS